MVMVTDHGLSEIYNNAGVYQGKKQQLKIVFIDAPKENDNRH
jgi:hypothetical protein